MEKEEEPVALNLNRCCYRKLSKVLAKRRGYSVWEGVGGCGYSVENRTLVFPLL